MANSEIIKNNVQVCLGTKVIEKQKQLKADLGTIGAQKILSVAVSPFIQSQKIDGNKVSVDGYAFYNVTYLTLDGACESMDYKADFADTFDIVGIGDNGQVLCDVALVENEVKPLKSDGELVCNTLLELKACAIMTENTAYVDADNTEGLCTKLEEQTVQTVFSSGQNEFEISNNVDLPNNFSRLLSTTSTLAGIDYYCTESSLVVAGQITSNILYLSTDENIGFQTKSNMFDFKYEIALEDGASDLNAFAITNLVPAMTTSELDEESGSLTINYAFNCHYFLTQSQKINNVVDAYCISQQVELDVAQKPVLQFLPLSKFEEQIHTSLVLEKDYESIERILGYSADHVVVTKALSVDGAISFEGIAYANILYQSYNQEADAKSNASVIAEMPFSFRLSMPEVKENDEIFLKANIADFDCRIKRVQELDIFSQLKIQAFVVKKSTVVLATDLKYGDIKQPSPYGLSVYLIEKGASAWEIAKQLSITTDTLTEQNPELVFPLEENSKIILYRQLNNNTALNKE